MVVHRWTCERETACDTTMGRERQHSGMAPREASSWSAMKATGKLVPDVGATARAFIASNSGLEAANASVSGAWPFSNRLESV
jgi:hypothetical protein